jgi:ribosomal protein S6E (S10)
MNVEDEQEAKREAKRLAKNKYFMNYYYTKIRDNEEVAQIRREQSLACYHRKQALLKAEDGYVPKKKTGRPRKVIG